MSSIAFGLNAFRRDHGSLPEWKLVNFFAEQSPTDEKGVILQSRGGMVEESTLGPGPIRAIYSNPGTYGGDRFIVSGENVYRNTTLLGTLAGSGPVSIAASATEVVFAAGSTPKSYNGTNFVNITFPDSASVTAVAYVSQLFIFLRAGSGRWYWSSVGDGRTIDALDYASAETSPDNLLDIQRYKSNMWLGGNGSWEPWFPTADPDLPFTRINQDVYEVGIWDTDCSAVLDNALYFVGSDGVVYRGAGVPLRISDFDIEEQIAETANLSVFHFTFNGHKFFVVSHDAGTHAFDVATSQWTQFKTYGLERWRIACAAVVGRDTLFGDYSTGQLWEMDADIEQDDGDALEGYVTAGMTLKGGAYPVDSLELICNTGRTEVLTGEDAAPTVEMRASRDAGATWNDWRAASMGATGEYRARARWRRLGMFDSPGAMFQFRFTDNVPRRVSDVRINEPIGGRARA